MKPGEFFLYLLLIFLGSFLALAAIALIAKSQISAQLSAVNPVNSLASLFGSKPSGS